MSISPLGHSSWLLLSIPLLFLRACRLCRRIKTQSFAIHTLSYVPDAVEALAAIYSVLRPGGRLILCEPNPLFVLMMLPRNLFNDYLPDENLVYCRSYRSWKRALRAAGFHDIVVDPHGEFPGFLRVRALRSRLIAVAHKVG